MSCRSTPAGSFATSVARLSVDRELSDPAVLSLFHELRRGYPQGALDNEDLDSSYQRALGTLESNLERLHFRNEISDARYDSLRRRLAAARSEPTPDPSTVYALHRLEQGARIRAARLQSFLRGIAARTGMTQDEARTAFTDAEANAPRTRGRHATRTEIPRNEVISHDPGVQHAVQHLTGIAEDVEIQLARSRPQRVDLTPMRPSVDSNGVGVTHAGYDPRVGHLVVTTEGVIEGRPGHGEVTQHAYRRVPQEVWDEMRNSPNPSDVWNQRIRGRSEYQYASEHEAALASAAPRCTNCGQYADAQHACPVPTPRIELTSWTGQQRWSRARIPVPGTETLSRMEEDEMSLPAIREFRTRVSEGPVRVRNVSGYFNGIRQDGQVVREPGSVAGNLTVARNEDGSLTVSTAGMHCSCPEYRRNGNCPHLTQVEGMVRNRIDPPTRARNRMTEAERETALREAQARAEQAAQHDWTRNPDTLQEAAATWRRESDVLYSENVTAFKEDYDTAMQARAAKNGEVTIPYMEQDALDGMATRGSGQGFGMEIEYDFPSSMTYQERAAAKQGIAQDLYDAGITRYPQQQGYGHSRRYGFVDVHTQQDGTGTWSLENDVSVGGGELVTPVMYDEPETWQRLKTATEIIRRHGGVASKKAGAHVHVGTGNYGGSPAAYTELTRMFTQHEDVYYRLASNPERGTHRNNRYATPLGDVPDAGFSDVSTIRRWQGQRTAALNLQTVNGNDNDHPEFRVFDSSLDPGTMQTQIKLAVATVNAAQRTSANGETSRPKEPWGSHKQRMEARGTRRRLSDEEFEADTATARSLIDTLFRRREDKAQATALFAHTKWSKSRRR